MKVYSVICNRHNKYLQHGIKRGFPVCHYKAAYYVSPDNWFFYCPECLDELKLEFFGENMFDSISL